MGFSVLYRARRAHSWTEEGALWAKWEKNKRTPMRNSRNTYPRGGGGGGGVGSKWINRENSEIYTGGRSWESHSLTQTKEYISPRSAPVTQSSQHRSPWQQHPVCSPRSFHTACLFPSSFMMSLWGLYFLELCWHWLLLRFLIGGRH